MEDNVASTIASLYVMVEQALGIIEIMCKGLEIALYEDMTNEEIRAGVVELLAISQANLARIAEDCASS